MDRHRELSKKLVREGSIREFKVSLVVELEQRRGVGVLLLEVHVVFLGLRRGVATFFANVHLSEEKIM